MMVVGRDLEKQYIPKVVFFDKHVLYPLVNVDIAIENGHL